ncbi:MAG: FemAB family PEP-CTERM system-associated protein [Deltaproteobacteria bacterium]|nr:FemAB family PEP-CTERM system-associated protein [Deltaproteobacteria bacterium]
MNIRAYRESDARSWDDYVCDHPEGTFAHLIGWKRIFEKSFGHRAFYLVSEEGDAPGSIRGLLPMFAIKSLLFGRSMVSVPFLTYGGILAEDEIVRDALYREAVRLTADAKLDYLEIRNERGRLNGLPVKDLYYGFKRGISADHDENLKAIPRKTRRMVRRGMSKGLDARFGHMELLDTFYDLFAFNFRSLGTPVFPKRYLRTILEEFEEASSVLVIEKDGRPLSGVLSLYFRDQVIPYYSGAFPEARQWAANDFLYWALMSDAASKGFRVFDFGRSKKDTGPYHFKRHWGFEPRPLCYQYDLCRIEEIPDLSPANPRYRRKIELWKKLPLWATKVLGPPIVKNIP